MTDLFSPAGISAWQARLNASPHFAHAAAGWHGSLVLVEHDDGVTQRRTWIVVADGACIEAREAITGDEARAEFVLAASADTWHEMAEARMSPTMAAIRGRLRLEKGELMRLLPHAKAAAALLAEAAHSTPD